MHFLNSIIEIRELNAKYNADLKTLLQHGIPGPVLYGDLVYKYKRIIGKPSFPDQFKKIIKYYTRAVVDGSPSQIPAFWKMTFTLGSRAHQMLPNTLHIMRHMHLRILHEVASSNGLGG